MLIVRGFSQMVSQSFGVARRVFRRAVGAPIRSDDWPGRCQIWSDGRLSRSQFLSRSARADAAPPSAAGAPRPQLSLPLLLVATGVIALAGGAYAAGALDGVQLPGSRRTALPPAPDEPVVEEDDPALDYDDSLDTEDDWLPVTEPPAQGGTQPGTQPGKPGESGTGGGDSGGYSVAIPRVDAVLSGKGRTFYVDYAAGKDSNSGTATSKPWKHAPGDSAASGKAKSTTLQAGDVVRLKGGVQYRGSLTLARSGTEAAPIIYTGTGYGSGQAIWDGADPVTSAVRCPSQAACGGSAKWRSLWLLTFTEPDSGIRLFDAAGPLFEASLPAIADPFWSDSIAEFQTVPLAQAARLASGRIDNAKLAAAARDEPAARLLVWVKGNLVVERAIERVSGSSIYFDGTGITPYTDRDSRVSLVGSVKAVTSAGQYARLGAGRAVVYPRANGGDQYYLGSPRPGFSLNGQSNIIIHGIRFVRGGSARGDLRNGVVLANYGKQSSNIQFLGNDIRDFSMLSGYGVIQLDRATRVVVRGNSIENIQIGSGMRFGGNVSDLTIEGNYLHKVGRTGIYLPSVTGARVRGNILSGLLGVHGNGMSYYLGHQNVTVEGNCVFDTSRPLTFHGKGADGPLANLRIHHNIFVSTPDARAGLYSWGSRTRLVTISDNVALGRKAGMILNASDQDVTATGNRTSGLVIASAGGVTPPGWTIRDNDKSASLDDSRAATLTANHCAAVGVNGPISIRIGA